MTPVPFNVVQHIEAAAIELAAEYGIHNFKPNVRWSTHPEADLQLAGAIKYSREFQEYLATSLQPA